MFKGKYLYLRLNVLKNTNATKTESRSPQLLDELNILI